jgi:hypothetical protein
MEPAVIQGLVVRGHQGQSIYEGNRCGAVFTVTLPPFAV